MNDTVFKLNFNHVTDERFPLPGRLSDSLTFKRNIAILRDDVDFLTWDHPFVLQTFEYFITNNTGSCALAKSTHPKFRGIYLETLFVLECMAPAHLEMNRYLSCDPIHILVDHAGNNMMDKLYFSEAIKYPAEDQKDWFKDVEPIRQEIIPAMLEQSISIAETISSDIKEKIKIKITETLGNEILRLIDLQKINPDIRDAEISAFRDQTASLLEHLDSARIRLDAIRLIRMV